MTDVQLIIDKIKIYRDHPVPGQLFADIFPIFRDPVATEAIVAHLEAYIRSTHDIAEISSIVCLESRGFFFAPIIALRLGLPCVPVRKRGKLPGEKISVPYQKEYGPDVFEMKTDAFEGIISVSKKVILMDDLLGYGGSIVAARQLVEKLGMEVLEGVFIFDLPDYFETNKKKLGGMKWYAMVHLTEENIGPKLG